MIGTKQGTDRGLSSALTHVLTIGVTTILIAMLMLGASAMLEAETERSTETSLETIGERLAGEIDNADRIVDEEQDDDRATIIAEHPQSVTNTPYTVSIHNLCESASEDAPLIEDDHPCLELTSHGSDVTVHVPIGDIDAEIGDENEAAGGTIKIENDDGEITITEAN